MGMNNSARREQLYGLLGELPPRNRPVTSRTLSTEQRDGYVLEHLELDLNGIEPVPAVFVRPGADLAPCSGPSLQPLPRRLLSGRQDRAAQECTLI